MTEPRSPSTKKIPKAAWVVGGVVAVGAVYWAYKKNSIPVATDASTQDTSGLGNLSPQGTSPSAYGYYDPTTGTFIAPGIQQYPGTIITPSTTQAWTQQAMAYLTQQGIDTTSFLSGVANWLYGPNRLSQAEYAAVEQAIAAEGLPPGITTVPALAAISQTNTKLPAPVLSLGAHRKGAAELTWSAVSGAARYSMHHNGLPIATPGGGARAMTVHSSGIYQVFAIATPPKTNSGASNAIRV